MRLLGPYPNKMHMLFLSILRFLIEFPMLFLVSQEEVIAAPLKLVDLAREKIIMTCAVGPWDF